MDSFSTIFSLTLVFFSLPNKLTLNCSKDKSNLLLTFCLQSLSVKTINQWFFVVLHMIEDFSRHTSNKHYFKYMVINLVCQSTVTKSWRKVSVLHVFFLYHFHVFTVAGYYTSVFFFIKLASEYQSNGLLSMLPGACGQSPE